MVSGTSGEGRRVWDLPTRLFHWSLAALIGISVLTGGEDSGAFLVHVVSGHLILLLILFRWIWGFIGSPRSRFADFLRPPAEIFRYARGLLAGSPQRIAGHNPLGGLNVLGFLVIIPAIVFTGLGAAKDEGFGTVSSLGAPVPEGLGGLHEPLVFLLYAMVALHLLAVVVDWWLTGDNLVAAMITGRKHGLEGAAEPPLASKRRFLFAFLPVLALGVFLSRSIDPARLAAEAEDEAGGGRRRRRRRRRGRDDAD